MGLEDCLTVWMMLFTCSLSLGALVNVTYAPRGLQPKRPKQGSWAPSPTKLMITNSPTGQLNQKTARKMPQNKHTIPAMSMSLKVMRPRKTMHLMTSHRLTYNHRPMNPHRNVHTLLYYKNALIMPVSLTITVKDCSIPKTREAIQLHSTSQEF